MTVSDYFDHIAYRNQVLLATAGHAYGPQFGPENPPEYIPRILDCGCSEEDTDGVDCGHAEINYPATEQPADYEFWLGERHD
jgi:hypothetical protein